MWFPRYGAERQGVIPFSDFYRKAPVMEAKEWGVRTE